MGSGPLVPVVPLRTATSAAGLACVGMRAGGEVQAIERVAIISLPILSNEGVRKAIQ